MHQEGLNFPPLIPVCDSLATSLLEVARQLDRRCLDECVPIWFGQFAIEESAQALIEWASSERLIASTNTMRSTENRCLATSSNSTA